MTAAIAAKQETRPGLAPFSLKDAPSFIEAQFPVGRLSAEAYKERKAGAGQTLTALGSYWKGRKPLILVRAVVLGTLLPATDDPAKDLDIFLKLMAMDDGAFGAPVRRQRESSSTRLLPGLGRYLSPKRLADGASGETILTTGRVVSARVAEAFRDLALQLRSAAEACPRDPRNATRPTCSPASGRR